MLKGRLISVSEYIAAQPEASRPVLERVRQSIRAAIPDAEEVISYSMPTYRLPSGPVIYFSGWKQHFSLYPASAELLEAFREELAPYEINNATIRFPLSLPVPETLIGRIAAFRAEQRAGSAGKRPRRFRQQPVQRRDAEHRRPSRAPDNPDR